MRLVGLLMVLLGGLIGWEVLQGNDPRTHLYQLVNLLFHSHLQAPGAPAGGSAGAAAQIAGNALTPLNPGAAGAQVGLPIGLDLGQRIGRAIRAAIQGLLAGH